MKIHEEQNSTTNETFLIMCSPYWSVFGIAYAGHATSQQSEGTTNTTNS